MQPRSVGFAAAAGLTLALGLGATQLLPGVTPVARASGLVPYDSCEDLLRHYRQELERAASYPQPLPLEASADKQQVPAESGASASTAVGSGPTGTNVQEQGVDEPDTVKLRDGRLVVLSRTRLRILGASADPRVLGSLALGADAGHGGGELLLVGEQALVVLSGWRQDNPPDSPESQDMGQAWTPGHPVTRVLLVDLDGDSPRLVEEATYSAQYVSARLVEGTVRLVTTTSPPVPVPQPTPREPSVQGQNQPRGMERPTRLSDVLPRLVRRDPTGNVLEQGAAVSCDNTSYAPGARGASTLLVTTFRPEDDGLEATDRRAVTTDGDLVYSSTDRLYVATSRWGTVSDVPMDLARPGSMGVQPDDEVRTSLHAFDTSSSTTTTYVGSGSVPGYVYGRWALSEHEGVLRVATTRQPPWNGKEAPIETSSMIVKLSERDGRLVETDRVSGLGRTEQIKSVRYFGELAAVVTFRQTDPLYLIDLGDAPKVLGELKIPGFSTYLHPIGDGLLLGVGHEATEQGQVTGMQVSVFDISDPSAPRQVDRLFLGAGWSPALEDSRAFTYDPDRRVAALPFTRWDSGVASGQRSFALGVYVSDNGTLRETGRMRMAAEHTARVLLDGSRLFAVSEAGVVAGDTATWTRTGEILFGSQEKAPSPTQ